MASVIDHDEVITCCNDDYTSSHLRVVSPYVSSIKKVSCFSTLVYMCTNVRSVSASVGVGKIGAGVKSSVVVDGAPGGW